MVLEDRLPLHATEDLPSQTRDAPDSKEMRAASQL